MNSIPASPIAIASCLVVACAALAQRGSEPTTPTGESQTTETAMSEFGMTTSGPTRNYEQTIRVNASPQEVWDAIATAEGLVRWFPLDASVKPGVGGTLFTSWRNEHQWTCPITIWEPPLRLRNLWCPAETPEPQQMGVDWFISRDGNQTVIRLVHFGIGYGGEWDAMYDGVSRGWEFELESLRRSLDEHPRCERCVVYTVVKLDSLPREEVWRRVFSPGGLLAPSLASLKEGQSFSSPIAGDFELKGTVRRTLPNKDFQATIDNLSGALLRVQIDPCIQAEGEVLSIWLSVWEGDSAFADRLSELVVERLSRAFGAEHVTDPVHHPVH
jgi:uncharacterized protein YndB with AHSA1/START domain